MGGGAGKIVNGVFTGRPQIFQWTFAAQDEGEWRKTSEQGAECFMAKWIAAEKVRARLRHAVLCLNVLGRTKKRTYPKASVLVLVRLPYLISHKGVRFADAMTSFSGVTFVLCYFCSASFFVFMFR